MRRAAIVLDTASDMTRQEADALGIALVPLMVAFGSEEFLTGVDISTDAFWDRLAAPGAPFPRTAACAPGDFQAAFERAFAAGAEGVVCVTVGSKLSATLKSAEVARDALPGREIHLVDSETVTLAEAMLGRIAAEQADEGRSAAEIAAALEAIRPRPRMYAMIDTLEYLKRGGRISAAQAAIGGALSLKPIITIEDGRVEVIERVRTRSKARERLLELLTAEPVARAIVFHCRAPEIEAFAADLARRTGLAREAVGISLVGPSIGPHLGPGAFGAVVLPPQG